jgi:crotonobetainyl-CoA:carnitine CoA-transferase CaiB-like acyl-CoA transferase
MGALDGIKVLDVSVLVQGPQAAAMLADLGATVIKIELPEVGDIARWLTVSPEDDRSAFFWACNRGKRSVTLDLRTAGGTRAFRTLVAAADVVVSNFQPGTMEAWGLGYAALSALNPRLIYATASAVGALGPDAAMEGADLTGQALGGLIATTGVDGGPVTPVGAVIADHCGAQNLVTGILAALFHRERTGQGQQVDVSLLGGQIWAQASEYSHLFLCGQGAGRANRGHPLNPRAVYGIFPTADGHIALVSIAPARWPAFCRVIERADLIDDPRFHGPLLHPEHRQDLCTILDQVFPTKTTAEWGVRLRAAQQRFAPVRTHAEVADDPQAFANGYLFHARHPTWGEMTVVGHPIRFSATPAQPAVVAPDLGQHTAEVLLEHGFTREAIAELRAQGAF